MNDELLNGALEQGACVLTANNRLARYLQQSFHTYKYNLGAVTWESPRILPFESWLRQSFDYLAINRQSPLRLINEFQQRKVWASIISQETETQPFLNISETGLLAKDAWMIANEWQYPEADDSLVLNDDQLQFAAWCREYSARCQDNSFIDSTQLAAYLADNIDELDPELPQQFIVAGYHDLSPQRKLLLEKLRANGVKVDFLKTRIANDQQLIRLSPADELLELEMAAEWARSSLNQNPQSKIAIVIPDLQQRVHDVRYSFNKAFFPQQSPEAIKSKANFFNISLGQSLISIAPARAAELLLKLTFSSLDDTEITELLLNRYLKGADTELTARSRLDMSNPIKKRMFTSLSKLIALSDGKTPILRTLLQSIDKVQRQGLRNHSQWVEVFQNILQIAGWPGEKSLDSEAYQQVEAVKSAITELGGLDQVSQPCTATEALSQLRALMKQLIFQAKAEETPIQIMGLLEVAGLSFDKIWVCSMDNEKWPDSARPNPLLPIVWQRAVGAPHASVSKELAYAKFQLNALKCAAPEVIFSHVAVRDDNQLYPAELISEIPLKEQVNTKSFLVSDLTETVLETFDDDFGPAVVPGEPVRGGTSLIKDQSECPFRAFAVHRLGIREIESAGLGIDPRDRGNFIHRILELFWNETQTLEQLKKLSPTGLRERLAVLADQVMMDYSNLKQLAEHEKSRLIKITQSWLELERERPDFTVIATELKREVEFEGIKLNLLVDRIDQIENDGEKLRVIIDYKSGDSYNPKLWMNTRTGEPQLPFYVITDSDQVDGAGYAFITAGNLGFKGFASESELVNGLSKPKKPDENNSRKAGTELEWPETVKLWRDNLTALAIEVKEGLATVSPAKGACQFCQIKPFCRINEQKELMSDS